MDVTKTACFTKRNASRFGGSYRVIREIWAKGSIGAASLLAMLVVGGADSSAATFVIDASDSGFVTEAGGSAKGDGTVSPATYNYSVGREVHYVDGSLGTPPGTTPLAPMDRKNYFVFDMAGVTGTIVSATLEIYAGPGTAPPFPGGEHGYESLDATETFELFETTDPGTALGVIGDLASSSDPADLDEPIDPLVGAAAGLHGVLGDGPLLLGATILSPADDGTSVSIPITPGGLGYVASFFGGTIVFGGTLSTAAPPATPQSVFGFTGPDIPGGDPLTPTLIIETAPIPVPAAMWLALPMLGALAASRLRRR